MFCHKCGANAIESADFCHKCGSNLSEVITRQHTDTKNTGNGHGRILTCIIWVCIMIVSSYLLLSLFNGSGSSNKEIELVRSGILEDYPQKTVGEAFDGYLSNTKWESGVTADGRIFVNVVGGGWILEQPAEFKVQFMVDTDVGTFKYYSCEVNGTPLSRLLVLGLLENVYE